MWKNPGKSNLPLKPAAVSKNPAKTMSSTAATRMSSGSSATGNAAAGSSSWGEWLSRHSTSIAASVALLSTVAAAAILYHRRRRGNCARPRPLRSAAPLTIVELAVYPIKSCRGINLASSPVCAAGLVFDRQWMLVDAATHVFVRYPLNSKSH
jgi:hypothetical protein